MQHNKLATIHRLQFRCNSLVLCVEAEQDQRDVEGKEDADDFDEEIPAIPGDDEV